MTWFTRFTTVHLFTEVSIAFMIQTDPDEPEIPRSRQLESSEMQGNSETIPPSPALNLSDHKDAGIGLNISKRTSGEFSTRETSNASSNGGTFNRGSSNGASSIERKSSFI